jgi:hypothetical protein
MTELQPIGIYSIPEVSYVGATEVDLTKDAVPYEVGVSRYRELARGQIAGDSYGMLKLLVSTEDLRLLGVHIFGTNATEMVHIGQAVMGCGGTVEYLVDAVFNYPTFSEAYKVAALDVMNTVGTSSPGPPASARASNAATAPSNGAEYDTSSAQPPPSSPPITPDTIEPVIHGAPEKPATRPPQRSTENPCLAGSVGARQVACPSPTPAA